MKRPGVKEPSWYDEPWGLCVILVFLPPLGMLLFCFTPTVSRNTKLTVGIALLVIGGGLGLLELRTGTLEHGARLLMAESLVSAARGHKRDSAFEHENRLLLRALHHVPLDASIWLLKANSHRNLEDCSSARRAAVISRLIGLHARSVRRDIVASATLLEAEILLDAAEHCTAEELLSGVIGSLGGYPSSCPSLRLLRARIRAQKGDFSGARQEIRSVINSFQVSEFCQAYRLLSQAEKDNPLLALAHLCEALRYREGDRKLEQSILEKGLETDVSLVPLRAYIRVLRFRRSAAGAGPAACVLEHIVDVHPDFVLADGALYTAAWCRHVFERDYHGAARLYQRVADDWPDGESALRALWQAASCYERIGLPRHRRRVLERLVSQAPRNSYFSGLASRELAQLFTVGRSDGSGSR